MSSDVITTTALDVTPEDDVIRKQAAAVATNRKERILQSVANSSVVTHTKSTSRTGRKRTLNEAISKLWPKDAPTPMCDALGGATSPASAPKCTWLLVGEDGRVLLKADAKTEKKVGATERKYGMLDEQDLN